MKTLLLLLPALWLCASLLRQAAAEGYPNPELLLEPAELAKPSVASEFVILDARGETAYQQAHIPGARRVDHDAWAKAFAEGEGKDADQWSQRIAQLGIAADSQVVIYDDKDNKEAARIWWILRYWGVDKARLLNGGWQAWTAENLPTTQEVPGPAATTAFKAVARSERLADMQQVLDMLHNDKFQIIDARSEKEFCGLDAQKNKRAGNIPGAKHLEWSDLIDPQTHRFKSADQLRALFEKAGIDLNRPAVSHCQSGGRAAVMAFGLELMGARDVRNYYRGWSEWGNTSDTPIEVQKEQEKTER